MSRRVTMRELCHVAIGILAASSACGDALAQPRSSTAPMPFYRRTAGWLVVDTGSSRVFRLRNIDGDGLFTATDEISIFVDATNASSVPGVSGSMLSLYQAADGTVYVGSNTTGSKAVYAVRDNNLDGDGQDASEVSLYCNQYAGVAMTAPFAITGDSNFIYVALSGSGTPLPGSQDGVARFRDANNMNGANDAGESSLYCDMNTIFSGTGGLPFDMCAIGSTLYIADAQGSPGRIEKAADTTVPPDGVISAAELTLFHTVGTLGSPTSLIRTCVTDGQFIYTHDGTGSVNPQIVSRLSDPAGVIDMASEVTTIWSETNLPAGEAIATSQSLAFAPGQLAICSNGTPSEIILTRDLTGNGLFNDAGDSTTIGVKSPNLTAFPAFPGTARYIIAYGWPCPADFNMAGGVTVQDLFDFLAAWFSGNARADINGSGMVTVQDIFDFLAAWFGGC